MSAAGPLDPDRLAATEFSTAFRGYDTGEVRALLQTVAAALREAGEREHELREQLARAEHHLRVLRETTEAQVAEAAEEARREGREMVAEAQRVRERMLGDLARRRRNARQQVEQLMAGRERLLEAFDAARQTIDAATQDMRGALPEARLAAEAAGRRFDQEVVGEDDEVAVAALEDEIEAARLVGLPLVAAEPEVEKPPADAAGRSEPSLLGERDVREMPAVELGADFEDVRIVPVEAPQGAPSAEEGSEPDAAPGGEALLDARSGAETAAADEPGPDEQGAEAPTTDDEPAGEDGSETGGAAATEPDAGEVAAEPDAAVADGAAPTLEGVADLGSVPELDDGRAEADDGPKVDDGSPPPSADEPAVEVAEAGASESDEEPPPVDPAHLDDLFASLRAARAEAVSDARTVLSRDDDDAGRGPEAEADPEGPTGVEDVEEVAAGDEAEGAEVQGEEAEAPAPEEAAFEELDGPDDPEEPGVAGADEADEADDEDASPGEGVTIGQDEERSLAGDDEVPPESAPVDVDQAVADAGERLASALKRVLATEQNELLDRLRQVGRNQRADAPGVIGDPADLVARFAAAAQEPLAAVAATAMASTSPDGRARPPAVEPLAAAAATELVEPLRERLERGFTEAGTDTAEASAVVRATFREWKTRRIAICAADAARGAFHAGLLAGVSRATTLVWVLDDEETACPECADNALAGPVARGERYPTGHRHPPAHDGCRCTLVVTQEPAP